MLKCKLTRDGVSFSDPPEGYEKSLVVCKSRILEGARVVAEDTLTLFYVRGLVTAQMRSPLSDESFYRLPVCIPHSS